MKDLANINLIWWTIPSCAQKTSAISALPYGWRFGVWDVQFTHFPWERYCHPFSDSVYPIFIHLYSGNWTQYTPSCFLPFLVSCNLFSARFNFLVTGRKTLLRRGFQVLMSLWHIKIAVFGLSWIVVNSHIIQIRIDLCAPLQTALYMPRTLMLSSRFTSIWSFKLSTQTEGAANVYMY